MAHYKFNVDIWVEGETEQDAESNLLIAIESEPRFELIAWDYVCKDIMEET